MASPKPPPPNEVPETAATYERTQPDTTLKREDAKRPGSPANAPSNAPAQASKNKPDPKNEGLPPPEHQQAAFIPVQQQTRRQQHLHQASRSDDARPEPLPTGSSVKGSMKTEEPLGWDQAPTDIKDPRQQRQPRPDGVGGSEPDAAKRDPQR